MKKGLLVHPAELTCKWIDRACGMGMDVLGIHPVGGNKSAESLRELCELAETREFREKIDYAKAKGLEIEYEMHAAAYLLDRSLFDAHPEYFRVDKEGNRTSRLNFCVSDENALAIVVQNAAALAQRLYGSSNRFYFWLDDGKDIHCHCEKCRRLTASDQALLVTNAMLREIRKSIPGAKLAYLAYYDTLTVPESITPEEGIFLEYAPLEKCIGDNPDAIEAEEKALDKAMAFFGKKDTKVLEYWLDNSMISKWKKPPVRFSCRVAPIRKDIDRYRAKGIEDITTFACYLGPDYEELYGEPDVTPYAQAFPNE